MTSINEQSPDIAQGWMTLENRGSLDKSFEEQFGAGDQGMMFGYTTNETDSYMPMPIYLALLAQKLTEVERPGSWTICAPMANPVTVEYEIINRSGSTRY